MSYDNSKQVVLTKVQSDSPKAPALRVNFEVDGTKYKAGLWAWTRKDGTPVTDKNGNQMYQGNYEVDTYTAEPKAAPSQETSTDDIPF